MPDIPHPPGPAGGDEIYREEYIVLDEAPGPSRRIGIGLISLIALAYLGVWIGILTPPFVSLAIRLQQVDPTNAVTSLSLILGVGGLIAIVGNPFFGRLSDRTTSRLGMRRPWLIGGSLVGSLGFLILALAQSVPVMLVGYCVAVAGFYAALAAMIALVPDQVPAEQRGFVSGVMGMGLPVAAIGGTFIVQAVAPSPFWIFMAPAAVMLVTILLLAFVLDDRRLDPSHRPPFRFKEFLSTFYVNPRRSPDFGWTWLSRFLFFMGIVTLTNYQPFFLTDRLGVGPAEVAGLVFISTLVHYAFVVALSVPSGLVSDRLRRRKVFVLVGALLFGAGLAVVALADSFGVFLIGMALAGIGEGIYIAVDLALVADVLPDRRTAAKDMGIFNVANSLPQPLAPAIAPIFLAIPLLAAAGEEGNNYRILFLVSALFALASALVIRRVKGVR